MEIGNMNRDRQNPEKSGNSLSTDGEEEGEVFEAIIFKTVYFIVQI